MGASAARSSDDPLSATVPFPMLAHVAATGPQNIGECRDTAVAHIEIDDREGTVELRSQRYVADLAHPIEQTGQVGRAPAVKPSARGQ